MKLKWIYFLPFVIYLLIYTGGFALTNDFHAKLLGAAEIYFESFRSQNDFFSYLFSALSVVTWIVIKIGLFLLFGIISGYVTLIVLSPVYAMLSEKTDELLRQRSSPFNLNKFIKDILRGILIAIRNGGLQLIWTILLFAGSFIPVVNLITAPALFIITAYFYGFSFLDYAFELKGFTVGKSIREVRRLKFASIVLGGIFLLITMIPWIGSLIAALLSFNLVVAGTQIAMESEKTS